jgi:hypothetical protein
MINMPIEDTGPLEASIKYRPKKNITTSVELDNEGSSPPPATYTHPEPFESTRQPISLHSDPILPSTPRSSVWSLSFGLSHQNLVQLSLLSHACHMSRPPHSPWFDLSNYISW